jgi:hypothetical protein
MKNAARFSGKTKITRAQYHIRYFSTNKNDLRSMLSVTFFIGTPDSIGMVQKIKGF